MSTTFRELEDGASGGVYWRRRWSAGGEGVVVVLQIGDAVGGSNEVSSEVGREREREGKNGS